MQRQEIQVLKGKYKECAGRHAVEKRLQSEGYSTFSWQDAPGSYYSPHSHPHLEYIVVHSGCITFKIDGRNYLLEAGDALVLPANTTHEAINDGIATACYFICTE